MKYELLALLAGISCKLYDDLEDNPLLVSFKTPFIMELLKGFHYVFFTCVSLEESLFFYINFYVNYLHLLFNKFAFTRPYEMSICFTYGVLFFIVTKGEMFLNFNFYDLTCVSGSFIFAGVEHFLCPEELSVNKLIMRSILIISILLTLWVSWIKSKATIYLCYNFVGYFTVSVIVQYYSVFVENHPLLETEKPPLVLEEEPVLNEKPPLDKEKSLVSAKIVSL